MQVGNIHYVDKKIGDENYRIFKVNGDKGLKGSLILADVFAGSWGAIQDHFDLDEEVVELSKQDTFEKAFRLVTAKLKTPEMMEVVADVLDGIECNGEKINTSVHFTGRPHIQMEVIIWAITENYKGFFTESDILASLMRLGLTVKASMSQKYSKE